MNKEFQTVGLYDHNIKSYKIIREAFKNNAKVVGIVHATGTGKSYNALQLAYDNKDKHIVYVVPSNGIIEHLKKIIEDNPNLDINRDFPNLEFRTYQSFINLSKEEIADITCDLLILDEFHHLGAPVWGARIETFLNAHEKTKVFGMTAYTIRDRGTIYERDMASIDTDELFSRNIFSRYDLCDAMIDGVLPKPVYVSAYTLLGSTADILEQRLEKLNHESTEYKENMHLLKDIKRRINEASSIPKILKKHIKPNGKYIYFCPPISEDGTNDIETIKKEALEWFKTFIPEENIIFYTSTSNMKDLGKKNREAFYNDTDLEGNNVSNKLQVMFAINQYNEGIHAPNIDGVIMGRGTTSDIVYFEQLGRALAVRGNTKEEIEFLERYSLEELTKMCKELDIKINNTPTKEELIEKLTAPIIIDLTNNFDYIKELENNLQERIKEIRSHGLSEHRKIKIKDATFGIEIVNQDLFEMLKYISDRLTRTWEEMYEFARIYYEHHGNLEIPYKFKTNDGFTYDENGTINLGSWINTQRHNKNLSKERKKLLSKIEMRFQTNKKNAYTWEEMYEYARKYFEHHGNLEVPQKFKTNDGYTYSEFGVINLGIWISTQRHRTSESSERGILLSKIKMRFQTNKKSTYTWEEMYEYARIYYERHGNLEIPYKFKTEDGFTYNEDGTIKLGMWIATQRHRTSELSEKGTLLSKIGMRFQHKISTYSWEEMYEFARIYYAHHDNLEVPVKFKTNDGFTYDENGVINLGMWINTQRHRTPWSSERGVLLSKIGMRFQVNKKSSYTWEEMYEFARIYYEHHGNLEIPYKFRTDDGFTYNEYGTINLGNWINTQRRRTPWSSERGVLLSKIGMRFQVNKKSSYTWEEMYEFARIYYEHHGNLEIPYRFRTDDGFTYNEYGTINLGSWINTQRQNKNLSNERKEMLNLIRMIWNAKKNREEIIIICQNYNIDYDKNKNVLEHISIQELLAKVEFLTTNNLPIVERAGLLNPIFRMSSKTMEEEFGISLEELINRYYIKDRGR